MGEQNEKKRGQGKKCREKGQKIKRVCRKYEIEGIQGLDRHIEKHAQHNGDQK